MSKQVRRRNAVVDEADEAEESDEEEGLEQQLRRKTNAQRIAASGKRPRSLAAERESDSSEDEDTFRDEYTYKVPGDAGLYKDVNDYNRLMGLSEFDREMEIAEREEIRQKNLEQFERRREIAREKKRVKKQEEEARAKRARSTGRAAEKASAGAADAADPAVPLDPKQQLLAEMREAREKRQQQQQKGSKEKDKPSHAASRAARAAGADADDEAYVPDTGRADAELDAADEAGDDDEPAGGRGARRHARAAAAGPESGAADDLGEDAGSQPAPYEQLERIRLTRNRLEAWLDEPFFDEVVVGTFVRVGIGSDGADNVYRVAEVTGVTAGDSGAAYALGQKSTRKRLILEIAGSRRPFNMSFVSNANFTPDELRKYRKLLEERMLPRKSQAAVDSKVARLKRAKDHVYSEQEVAAMLEKKLDEKKIIGSTAMRRQDLINRRDAAQEKGNTAEVSRLNGLLSEIDQRAAEQRRAVEGAALPSAAAHGISSINERNRRIERQAAEVISRAAAQRAERGAEDDTLDPFARRETRPSMYWHVSAPPKPAAAAAAPAAEPAASAAASTADPKLAKLMREPTSEFFGAGSGADGAGAGADGARAANGGADGGGPDAGARAHGSDVPPLVAAHAVDVEIEIIDAKPAPARANASAAGLAPDAKALESVIALISSSALGSAAKRISLSDYRQRRMGM